MTIPVFFIAVGVYLIQPFELQSPRQIVTFGSMIPDPCTTVAFTGHRTYCGEAAAALAAAIRGLHAHGFRTFLCGMAVGFDLAAAEAVLELRGSLPGLRLVAVVPFGGQEARFSHADRARYRAAMASADDAVVLSPSTVRGVMPCATTTSSTMPRCSSPGTTVRPGGTCHTVSRTLRRAWNS